MKQLKPDIYLTGGKKMGRMLRCNKPFARGNGVYYFSTNDEDWEQIKGEPLTREEMRHYISAFRDMRIHQLKEAVRKHQHEGVILQENDYGAFRVLKKIS